jgi:predicted nuclease of predicted toxin-antitoxin system
MRFLIDENLSRHLAELLTQAGHDAVHADTDFGALLAHSRATKPSVILVRALADRRPPELAGIIAANLDDIQEHLHAGAIAAFTQDGIRVRPLPLR